MRWIKTFFCSIFIVGSAYSGILQFHPPLTYPTGQIILISDSVLLQSSERGETSATKPLLYFTDSGRNIWEYNRYCPLTCASIHAFNTLEGLPKKTRGWRNPMTPRGHKPCAPSILCSFFNADWERRNQHWELSSTQNIDHEGGCRKGSYISPFVCLYNLNYTGRPLRGPGIIVITSNKSTTNTSRFES